jgi:hypothetical protein
MAMAQLARSGGSKAAQYRMSFVAIWRRKLFMT